MNKLFSLFNRLITDNSKKQDENILSQYSSNSSQSKRIQKIFEVDSMDTLREQTTQKIIYNEKVYFNPLQENSKEEVKKVISNAIKFQTQKMEIEKEGKNVYKVNLNINNNYYGSNFNINYGDKKEPKSINKEINEIKQSQNSIGLLKSVPCKGGSLQDAIPEPRNSKASNNERNSILSKENAFVKKKANDNQLSVPCLNCGNLVDMNDIENHSMSCLIVKEEVMNENRDLISYNIKLKKLDEFICKSKKTDNRDSHYFVSLSEYINNAASKIITLMVLRIKRN